MTTTGTTGLMLHTQRFSLDDGPGIRTTVFFKGCNLHCVWCHNPESIHPYPETAFAPERCTRCGVCAATCEHGAQICTNETRRLDRALCVRCMNCVDACAAGALTPFGRTMTCEHVMNEVLRDRAFYERSGGGVTFSGGEPMLQQEFLLELLIACNAHGLGTAVDTAGNVSFDIFAAVLPHTDLFLYDIKAYDPLAHRRCTGVDNARIIQNLRSLGERGSRTWVRLPFAPGMNNDDAEIASIAALLNSVPGIERIELLPYHRYGEGKCEALGMASDLVLRPPESDEIRHVLAIYRQHGLSVECTTAR